MDNIELSMEDLAVIKSALRTGSRSVSVDYEASKIMKAIALIDEKIEASKSESHEDMDPAMRDAINLFNEKTRELRY